MKASAPVTGRRTRTVRAVRGAHPGCFALVMSTGSVTAALRQAGSPRSSAVLLAIAAGSFSALAVASAWRAAAFPADLRGDLACPGHGVYLVAACDVPGTGSPADGQYAAALAAAGFHRHARGQWRRRRVPPSEDQSAGQSAAGSDQR